MAKYSQKNDWWILNGSAKQRRRGIDNKNKKEIKRFNSILRKHQKEAERRSRADNKRIKAQAKKRSKCSMKKYKKTMLCKLQCAVVWAFIVSLILTPIGGLVAGIGVYVWKSR